MTRMTIRSDQRSLAFCLATTSAIVVVAVLTLTLGDLGIAIAELPGALTGHAEGKAKFVLERLRGPRLLTAILAGALLGISGALFQTVTRNPLGSPDVIGIGAGAGAGVAIASLMAPLLPPSVAAITGAGLATALVAICTGRGFRSPARTIIAGIAVAALAFGVTQYVVSISLHDSAQQLAGYLAGSLNAANMRDVLVTGLGLAVIVPLSLAIAPDVSLLEMGDETASGVGVEPDRTRTCAVVLSACAAGVAVSAVGPVAFVALTAPQIARRVLRTADVSIPQSALTGALIMTVADLAAQQATWAEGLPVGVLTLGVGGMYLGYLLVRERRRGRL